MSLEKAIEYGKDRRKPYTDSKRFDKSCRNHGGCDYCKDNRLYSSNKALEAIKEQLKESKYEDDNR